jgi:hypothetical protein
MNLEIYIVAMFVLVVLYHELNISYRIKRILPRVKVTDRIKVLDCFPCFCFWTSLICTFNIFVAMAVYVTAILIDRK